MKAESILTVSLNSVVFYLLKQRKQVRAAQVDNVNFLKIINFLLLISC